MSRFRLNLPTCLFTTAVLLFFLSNTYSQDAPEAAAADKAGDNIPGVGAVRESDVKVEIEKTKTEEEGAVVNAKAMNSEQNTEKVSENDADIKRKTAAEEKKAAAVDAFNKKKFDKASILAQDAAELNPSIKPEMDDIIKKCEKEMGVPDQSELLPYEEFRRNGKLKFALEKANLIIKGDSLLEQAKQLVEKEKYEDALKLIDNARNDYNNSLSEDISSGTPVQFLNSKVNASEKKLKADLADYIKHKAFELYAQIEPVMDSKKDKADVYYEDVKNRYQKVKDILREAMLVNPDLSKNLQKVIASCDADINAAEYRKITDMEHIGQENSSFTMDPDRPQRKYEIDASLKQTQIFIDNEEYILARNALEKILARDPYNIKAMTMLGNLYQKFFNIAKLRAFNEDIERMSEVRWKWNEPVLPAPAIKPPSGPTVSATSNTAFYQKLNEIVIDHMDFENAPLASVIQWLTSRSKELDPNKEGVSIMLNIKPERLSAVPSVTMNFDNIPVGELVRYICQNCGLKYRVEEHAIIIGDDITDVMETRFFKVRAALISRIVPQEQTEEGGITAAEGGGTAADFFSAEDTFSQEADRRVTKRSLTSEALIAYFTERGVPFPESASIAYNRAASKLTVTNTPENLRRLENILREIDLENPLVLIESKFIELTETDLNDLGFEWLFSKDSGRANPQQGDSYWQITQNSSTTRPLGTNASGILSPVNSTVNDRIINDLVWPGFGSNRRMHLTMFLHALDRSHKAEILSAPKVIATSGQEANIRIVREEYFPASWSEPTVAVTNGVFQITPPLPDLGTITDMGILLTVTPTVSPNNYTITLILNPQVVDLAGWTDNFYTMVVGGTAPLNSFNLKMPEISRRDAQTTVKVYDGETVVLGGMIREDVSGVDDRIPGLGDLPLVGRLARTKNQQSVKRNLMIFVTARLINPDGMPVRDLEGKGRPDFRR